MKKELLFCTIDFETTGLNTEELEITEMGWVLHTHQKIIGLHNYMIKPSGRIPEALEKLIGITNEDVELYGVSHMFALTTFIADLYFSGFPRIDYFIGYNGTPFDSKIFKRYMKNYFKVCNDESQKALEPIVLGVPWLDTMNDIPFPPEFKNRTLRYLALDHGHVMNKAHRAVFDCLASFDIFKQYSIESILKSKDDPEISIKALIKHPWVDGSKSKDWVKASGFRGSKKDDGTYDWVKKIRKSQLTQIRNECPVAIEVM
jgi:DNA polymerase III alpha subunit (gram-positive type)